MAPPLRSSRRDVLTALGTGAAFAAVGGTVAGRGDDEQPGGYVPDVETSTVHRVWTRIAGPPTNPDRPADFFYEPTGLHVEPGDVVQFVFETPDHNVVPYHPAFGMRRRIPTGVTAFSSPLLGWRPESIGPDQIEPPAETGGEGGEASEGDEGGEGDGSGDGAAENATEPVPSTWLLGFAEPGVYDFLCSPHETFGMAMRVVVGAETETRFETEDADALPEPRVGPVGLARATLTDPALQPSNIVAEDTVSWSDLAASGGGGGGGGSGGSGGGGNSGSGGDGNASSGNGGSGGGGNSGSGGA
ncbi:plastocyanin/azurin family copper-binding protein [Halobacterium litoreum]|uniref:Plastocyanin/azurin family copper-binding protein n=1 Tax=Halobacterium litoreum TaxID=2039234 RepID=A0ABD5NCS0_9EURY|nr:plastocyanin/azurin family copper-binding protein [Halobacterium litoreum]UHH14125.1 hypothetical protein LT972_03785 [Halobacterium litoreum]